MYPCLVLAQHRKARPDMTEIMLIGTQRIQSKIECIESIPIKTSRQRSTIALSGLIYVVLSVVLIYA